MSNHPALRVLRLFLAALLVAATVPTARADRTITRIWSTVEPAQMQPYLARCATITAVTNAEDGYSGSVTFTTASRNYFVVVSDPASGQAAGFWDRATHGMRGPPEDCGPEFHVVYAPLVGR